MAQRGFVGSAGATGAVGAAVAQFAVCRQPWNEYIQLLAKQDSEPFHAAMNPKPMYRGRKRGFEEWNTGSPVQLHFRRFPDEHVIGNLTRWRQGDLVGDLALQQFKNAQPHIIDQADEDGQNRPDPETFMKLNYKNPATIGRFLTRSGHFYPQDILPLNVLAAKKLRQARRHAFIIGLFPRTGNPFWFRSQVHRPKPYRGDYDPVRASTKQTMEHFCFNWLQTHRIKSYFQGIEQRRRNAATNRSNAETIMQSGIETEGPDALSYDENPTRYSPPGIAYSPKVSTVPGLMSLTGLQRPMSLYSSSSSRRMGIVNPLRSKKL